MVLFAGAAAFLAVQRYLPYVSPDNVCFSRNGVALGGPETCRQASPQRLAQHLLAYQYFGRLPVGWAKLSREIVHRCRQRCQEIPDCSFYILRPAEFRTNWISGNCIIHK